MRKPTVLTKCVANFSASQNERIVEVSDRETGKGCLISIRRINDGSLVIAPYRADPGVFVWMKGHEKLQVPN